MAGSFGGSPNQAVAALQNAPGTPAGPAGLGGVASPQPGAGWEVFVRSYADYHTLLCQVPFAVVQSLQCVKQLNDVGSGSVTLDMDAPWWKTAVMFGGSTANTILDFECLWQITQDGVPRFEFLGETITEQLVDASEQRLVTVTGPGTAAVLKWAMAAPSGFPSIILKLDGLVDDFGEIGSGGAGVLDTNIWNNVSPSGAAYVTPVPQAYSYPGGAGYSLSSLYPSGTLTIAATSGTTLLGSTPWDATDTLVSAQIAPVGAAGSATDSSGNAVAYGTGLDGSELTQMYVESLKTTAYVAGFGLSAKEFYCWFVGSSGTSTHVIVPSASYDLTNYAYWMITEQGGTGGGTGTFYWWTSPDGSTWTQQWSAVHTWDATEVGLFFTAKYDTSGQAAILSAINSNVTTPSYQGSIYLNQSAMGIWADLLATAQARGTIPFVTTSASGTADSFGNAWTDVQNVQVTNGTDLFIMLQSFCSVLDADFVMQPGFRLQVGQDISLGGSAVSLGIDRSAQVVFREGKDELAKQRTRARDKIANLLGVENSDGREISANSATSIAEWGQREGWFQTSALVDTVSMEIAAAAFTAAADTEVLSWTLSILPNVAGRTVFSNFDVGDWVGLERPDFTAVDAVRVVAIAIQVNQDGLETHELTLESYLAYLQEQFTYISNKLGGGFVTLPGTTPVAPSKYGIGQVPTWFAPAATLANLADVVGTGAGAGEPLVYNPATGQWQPATSVNPMSGNALGLSVSSPGGTVSVSTGVVTVSGAAPAPALDGGGTAPTGPTVTVGTQSDGTVTIVHTNGGPPATPDTPTVVGGPGTVTVGWDGLLASAAPLLDFLYVQVHLSTASGFTPSSATLQGTLPSPGGLYTIGSLSAGTTYYAKLVAYNKSMVASPASAQASGVPIVSGGAKVTVASTAPSSPVIGDLWYNSANGYELEQWNGSTWSAYQFGTGAIAAGAVTASLLNGAVTARVIGGITTTISASAPGSPLTGDIWVNTTLGVLEQWSGAAWVVITFNAVNAVQAGSITASLLNAAVTARVLGGITTTISTTAPGSPVTGDIWINTTNGVQEQWSGSAWVVITFNAANAIQAGTITATQIHAATITGSLIAAGTIAAGNLVANTITSGQIASGTITATQIQAATITGSLIAAGTIAASNIVANTITAGQIAASTITAAQLAANSVTSTQIAAGTIQASDIAAGTITAANLAAGIVVATIVDGTTITGASVVADGTSGEILVYSGTPSSSNLIGSWSGAVSTDSFSTAIPEGLMAQALTLPNQASTPGSFSGASVLFSDANGRLWFTALPG